MLVLTRCIGEEVRIGDGITVRVISIDGERVKLGFNAPDDVKIMRSELLAIAWPADRAIDNGH